MQKVLTIRIPLKADGTVAGIERISSAIDRLGNESDQATGATRRLAAEQQRQASTSSMAAMSFGKLSSILGGIVGAGTLGLIVREAYQYNQELESTKIGIAGLLNANREYLGTNDQWAAALGESSELLRQIQIEALKTKSTVPQLGNAFATTFGATTAAGIKATNAEILQMATRLTQVGNAFGVIPEQMRQEINSLVSGMVTEDSLIAKRLGFDNQSIKEMQRNGTFVAELLKRTESYAKAAEAQSNTLSGKLLNTKEVIVATIASGLEPLSAKISGLLDQTFGWFQKNGDTVVSTIQRVIGAVDIAIDRVGAWAAANRELLESIASTALIVGAAAGAYMLIGGAIAALSSPIFLAIAGIVALGVAWQKVSELSGIQVGGVPIAAYIRATTQFVVTAWSSMIVAQVGGLKFLYHTARMIFSGLGEVILTPIHFVVKQVVALFQSIPAPLAQLIPGFDRLKASALELQTRVANVFKPLEHADKGIKTLRDTASLLRELTQVGAENAVDGLLSTDKLASPKDLVASAWGEAKKYLEGLLPDLQKAGSDALNALFPSVAKNAGKKIDPKEAAAAAKAAEKLHDQLRGYQNFMNEFRNAAGAMGDPLAEQIAKVESQREDAIARFAELNRDLEKALGPAFNHQRMQDDFSAIETVFDAKRIDAISKSIEHVNKEALGAARDRFQQETEYALEEQRRQNVERIALIEDAGAREIATRIASIDEWFAAEKASILETVKVAAIRDKMLENLAEERKRRVAFETAEQKRIQNEQLVGTREWARKMAREIGTIPQQVTRVIGESKLALAGMFDGVIQDLIDGQEDFGKSFNDLTKNLASTWGKMLSDILTKTIVNGESIVSQLKGVWQQLGGRDNPMTGGWGDLANAGLGGAGLGAFVGSVVGGPNNFGAEGGMIAGALGAAIGYYFAGAGGAKIGAIIGSAIGSAVGSMIQKGTDWIRVSIANGVATVTEKGISLGAGRDVEIQVQRRIKEETKAWQSILDLFPEHVRKALESLPKPNINTGTDVEDADITDAGALNVLGDFLGNVLPKATFAAYSRSIRVALETMGVEAGKIGQLFSYWGTLQGQELQEAVRGYVMTMLEAVEMRDLMAGSIDTRINEARRRSGMTSIGQLDEIKNQIALVVASAAKLTDIEDVTAAQEQVNVLARQYYELGIQRLQRIDAIEEGILAANESLLEQINLAGMDDQEKIDYFYDRLGDLRTQLGRATDPEEIARITAEMQRYVQQALGLAPDSEENREKLRQILADLGGLSQQQLDKARQEQAAKDKETLDLLKAQLEALMGIRNAIDPPDGPSDGPGTGPGDGPSGGGPGEGPGGGGPANRPNGGRPAADEGVEQLYLRTLDVLRDDRVVWTDSLREQQAEFAAVMRSAVDPRAIGDAVADAMRGMQFRGVFDEPIEIDNGGFGDSLRTTVTRDVLITLRNDPDFTSPR